MKSNEELNTHKEEVKTENNQRCMLKDEEMEQVTGGSTTFNETDPLMGQNTEEQVLQGSTVYYYHSRLMGD